jgi:RHS repeat-associated protein
MPNPIQHGTHNDRNIIVDAVYDKGGRMIAMRTPNGHLTEYDYDTLGRRTGLTNPLGQTWETAYADLPSGGSRTTATYPGLASGGSYDVSRDFDALGRLTQIHYGNAGITPTVSFGYDAAGNRVLMSEHNGTANSRITEYDYDAARRLTAVATDADADGTPEQTVGYAYDIAGRRTQLTFDGVSVGYEYDERGRLVKVTDWNNGETTFGYDGAGRHTATNRPNGVSSAYAHDPAGRLTEILHQSGEDVLTQFGYTVDGRGNRTQAVETLRQPNGTVNSRTVNYSYDTLARLLNANDGTNSYGYSFDRAGNRLSQTVNGLTTSYSYNAANQLTSDGVNTHTYDPNGNLTSDGVTAYSWDRANRMLSAGDHSYAYDGNGVRILQTVNGIVTDYLQDTQPGLAKLLTETTNGTTTRTLHGLRGVLMQSTPSTGVAPAAIWGQAMWGQSVWGNPAQSGDIYLLEDGVTSIRSVTASSGAVIGATTYAPFGTPEDSPLDETPFGFTGEYTDDNELLYLRARYYAPNAGIFTTLDPFEGLHQRPMSLNGYSWVEGNPIMNTDPSGTSTCLGASEASLCSDPLIPSYIKDTIGCNEQDALCRDPLIPGYIKQSAGCWSGNSQWYQDCYRSCESRIHPRAINRERKVTHCTRECLEQKYNGWGSCKIELLSFNFIATADGPLSDHAFILFTPEGGNDFDAYVFRGGPTYPGNLQNQGPILAEGYPVLGPTATGSTNDYPRWDPIHNPRWVLESGTEACYKLACLREEARRITSLAVNYNLGGPNSNTVARTMLDKCGIDSTPFNPANLAPALRPQGLVGWYNTSLE